MKMVALIPARAGSKRIPGKNTRLLAGKPLIAWTIQAALESEVFECGIVVSTEDPRTANLAMDCGARVHLRDPIHAADDSPDIEWVKRAIVYAPSEAFAILRPTSPFRTADTIRRAYKQFSHDESHSMRAVQPVKERPEKMWLWAGPGYPIAPYNPTVVNGVPLHSSPTQTFSKMLYVQNASLEMAWSYVIPAFGTISGRKVSPFFTQGYEGFDLNTEDDWQEAERLIAEGKVALPSLARL